MDRNVPGRRRSSRPFYFVALVATTFVLQLWSSRCPMANAAATASAATVPEARHVRHKRTVSDFVEGLMNAVYFHMDPEPLPSTVIAHITRMPAASRVYK